MYFPSINIFNWRIHFLTHVFFCGPCAKEGRKKRTGCYGSREARARCSGWGRKSESATDRPTRHDTTPLTPYLKFDHFQRKFVKLQRTPYLKMNHFRRKLGKLRRTPYLKTGKFRRKLVKLRRTHFLKTGNFRRKLVKIGETEAHSLFENWQVSTKICEN